MRETNGAKNGGKVLKCVWRRGCSCLSLLLALEVRPGEGLHGGEEPHLAHPPRQRHGPALLHTLHGGHPEVTETCPSGHFLHLAFSTSFFFFLLTSCSSKECWSSAEAITAYGTSLYWVSIFKFQT